MKLLKSTVDRVFHKVINGARTLRTNGKMILNGRCPKCGDSQYKKKKRLYCLEADDHWTVYCHNCNYSTTFQNMIREFFPDDYSQLNIDIFNSFSNGKIFSKRNESFNIQKPQQHSKVDDYLKIWYREHCIKLDEPQKYKNKEKLRLYARSYLEKRFIANALIDSFYVCYEGKYNTRIIIPFVDNNGLHYNFQARDIHPNPDEARKNTKYLFAEFDDMSMPESKIYNQFNVMKSRTVWVCEGIIDSMFIENSIALCNANVVGEKADYIKENYKDRIWVLDSPWKDKTGYERTLKLLENGEKCFIMPKGIIMPNGDEAKDINDWAISLGISRIKEALLIENVMGEGDCKTSLENKLVAAKLILQKVK